MDFTSTITFVVYEQVTPEARSEVHIVVDNGYWLLTFDFQAPLH